jgi:hypothetical protein
VQENTPSPPSACCSDGPKDPIDRGPLLVRDRPWYCVVLPAMTLQGGKPQPILFVDGPSLGRGGDAKSRNTRSALIRRRISEKRSTYRQEEEAKREQLIAERQTRDKHLADQGCTCRTVRDQDQAQAHGSFEPQTTGTRTSVTVPQSQTQTQNSISDGTLFRICGTCGGVRVSNRAQGSTSPALSLSIVSSRVDPFSPVDVSVGPSVDDILHHGWSTLSARSCDRLTC